MRTINQNYIDGRFVPVQGTDLGPLFNPATEEQIATVHLSNAADVDAAVRAAVAAYAEISTMSNSKRVAMLHRLSDVVSRRSADLAEAMSEEYGAPAPFVEASASRAGQVFLDMAQTVEAYPWQRQIGSALVEMRPVGVAAAVTPWNSNLGFICSKLATAIAAGTSIVIKPSEMSAWQTQVLAEALDEAELPNGVYNIINGTGALAGDALTRHRDIAKITFTGSTETGRAILRAASDTMKRVTLELGGKGAQIVLDDADLDTAAAQILANGFINSGQACIAGTRILVPEDKLTAMQDRLVAGLASWPVGPGSDARSRIGPMVSAKQWERVQAYIALGQQEGARLLAGGEGRPEGLNGGWFVRPTLFGEVDNHMRIAREEIFGPVLCVLPYRNEDHAISITNDTDYGLQNYVIGADPERCRRVASRLQSGRVVINGAQHEPHAPFGGFKQSGIGREYGSFGLEAFLEPRSILE